MSSLLMCKCVLDGQLRQADPSVLFRYVPAAHSPHHPDLFTCPCHMQCTPARLHPRTPRCTHSVARWPGQ
eukprot:3104581-Rhodomonas_salina.1